MAGAWRYFSSILVTYGHSNDSNQTYLISIVVPAKWPMLAACFVLYYLRDLDTLRVVGN